MGGRAITKAMPLERWLRDAIAGLVMPPSSDRCVDVLGLNLLYEGAGRKAIEFV